MNRASCLRSDKKTKRLCCKGKYYETTEKTNKKLLVIKLEFSVLLLLIYLDFGLACKKIHQCTLEKGLHNFLFSVVNATQEETSTASVVAKTMKRGKLIL